MIQLASLLLGLLLAAASATAPVPAQEPADGEPAAATVAGEADRDERLPRPEPSNGPVATGAEVTRQALAASITADEVKAHIDFLAGPHTRGRATLTPGFDLAAAYVEERLRLWGLEPAGEDGSYRVPVGLRCAVPSDEAFVEVIRDEDEPGQRLALGSDFMPIGGTGEAVVEGEPVFVGFAIDDSSERWNDMKKVDGKIVFAFTREPYADDPKSKRFDGLEPTRGSQLARKAREVAAADGLALVLVPDPGAFPDEVGPVPNLLPQPLFPGMQARQMRRFVGLPDIPVLSMSRAAASAIFEEDLDEYYEDRLKRKRPKQLDADRDLEIRLCSAVADAVVPSYNLAAVIPGSDEDGELIVIGTHLDHVGYNHYFDQGLMRVHPGADDNASGTAALLEVAEALAGTQPKDTILLLWFTGEENGLLGSRSYCDKPLFPHDQTVIMLNMDQIARTDPEQMNLGGLWDEPDWQDFSEDVADSIDQELDLDFDGGRELFQRSDHFSFYSEGVPVIFYFEGDIDDNPVYHKPGDVPDTINHDKPTWVARQVLATAWALAGEGARP